MFIMADGGFDDSRIVAKGPNDQVQVRNSPNTCLSSGEGQD